MDCIYRIHALRRMFERGISRDDVRAALATFETIEEYPDDMPYASRLVLGWSGDRPLHIVFADNHEDGERVIITVYQPDPEHWDGDFVRRRQ